MLCSAIGNATRSIVRARLSPFFPSPEDISINPALLSVHCTVCGRAGQGKNTRFPFSQPDDIITKKI
jgi:hypothetical protein